MTLTIDNLDGLGSVDYSTAIDRSAVFAITRALNRPSTLKGLLCLEASSLRVPVRQARVVVASDFGSILFTGYLATEPVALYAGVASAGPVYRWALAAVSDEWLLDKQSAGTTPGPGFSQAAGALFQQLVTRLAPGLLTTTGVTAGHPVGAFAPATGSQAWSAHAATLANTTSASYRALSGALSLTTVGSVTHALAEGDGSLSTAGLEQSAVRELANDVMLSGAIEPRAYWTELFEGDGTTALFPLAGEPSTASGGHVTLIADSFNATTLNPNLWALTDPGSHLSLSGATTSGGGLTLNGGNGLDGQTTVIAYDQLELGGTLVIELGAVRLASGSAGMLAGLYAGTPILANCVAGFSVAQGAGETVIAPVVNGMVTGTPFTVATSDFYTLRLHLHCPELLRVKQAFYALSDSLTSFGGGLVAAPLAMVFEIRDQGASSNTPVTVLYDGAMQSSPAQASFVLVNALELFGSIGAVTVTRTGSAWVVSTPPGGSTATRLAGKVSQGVDFSLTSPVSGQVSFFPGRVPVAGESFAVNYRGRARAVARLADPTSLAAEAAGGSVGTARWVGKVLRPAARSAEDCENAAAAILSFSTSRAAAVTGSYTAVWPLDANPDLWPGDRLSLPSASVIVREVTVEDHGAAPEALTYRIAFANNWAQALSLTLSEDFALDAVPAPLALDLIPSTGPGTTATVPTHVLANLQQMTVAGATGSLAIDAGLTPPSGGGFEVRRRDAGFGTGPNAAAGSGDLVLRSPVRGFSIPRAAVAETFFVRMYDASSPPLYSRESAAIVTHLPIS